MAEKYGFISVLEEALETHFTYDYEINWDKAHFAVEVSFVLEVENPENVAVTDVEGTENTDNIFYEDTVLFYDASKTEFDAEDYLVAIPYEAKEGFSREFLEYFAQFLQDTADAALDDLTDFLASDATDFAISWDAVKFDKGDEALVETEFYKYPRY
jgi:hypothetical protein